MSATARGTLASLLLAALAATPLAAGSLTPAEIARIEGDLGVTLTAQQAADLGAIVKPDTKPQWRLDAEARIATHRTARLDVRVRDTAGRPLEGAEVTVRQRNNAFRFGGVATVMDLTDADGNLAAAGSTPADWQRIMTALFNAAGLNNGFKPKITGQHAYIPGFLDWAAQHDIAVRAHLLMWPGGGKLDNEGNLTGTPGVDYGDHLSRASTSAYATHDVLGAVEAWANAAPADRAARAAELEAEVDGEIAEWASRWDVYEWDVINETVGNTLLQEILGWDRMARWFRLARDNAWRTSHASRYPETRLYINEFKIVSAAPTALDGGSQYSRRKGTFMDRIDRVRADGGPLGGIGFQSRFRYGPVDPAEVYARIDEFATAYPALTFAGTEFEVKDGDDYLYTEYQRAQMTEELLTTYYSHPRVVGLNAWDFMSAPGDPDPTEVTAALAWYDGAVKLNGLAWYYLHRIRYATDAQVRSDAAGNASVRAYRGEHEVTVRHGGAERTLRVTLDADRTVEVEFDSAVAINAGFSDAWYDPATAGQGFFITVFPVIEKLNLAWFTFDTERPPGEVTAIVGEPGHRWLTALGPYAGNRATLTLFRTEGGRFDAVEPAASTDEGGIGTMTLEFADCSTGRAVYDIPELGLSGEIPIQRVTGDNVPLCEALAAE
jgi:GH35 family endo-1,4-beta-xylanase